MVIKLEEIENVANTVQETSHHPQPMSSECLCSNKVDLTEAILNLRFSNIFNFVIRAKQV